MGRPKYTAFGGYGGASGAGIKSTLEIVGALEKGRMNREMASEITAITRRTTKIARNIPTPGELSSVLKSDPRIPAPQIAPM